MDSLHSIARKLVGRNESLSTGIIDSRSVKTSHYADPSRKGIDGNKKVTVDAQSQSKNLTGPCPCPISYDAPVSMALDM